MWVNFHGSTPFQDALCCIVADRHSSTVEAIPVVRVGLPHTDFMTLFSEPGTV